jgi:hypothetical protein
LKKGGARPAGSKKLLLLCARWSGVRDSEQKFFGSFFQKRTFFVTAQAGGTSDPHLERTVVAEAAARP